MGGTGGEGGDICVLMADLLCCIAGHLTQRVDSLEKTLMLGGIGAGGEGDDRG